VSRLLAISDLHVGYAQNRDYLRELRPTDPADWLLVAGDVAEVSHQIEWALGLLRERFATVVWVPGNHELWTPREDPVQLRGEERYRYLVDLCRRLDVLTPEDPYPVWQGEGGPVTVVPLFILYDYTFWPDGATSVEQALAMAYAKGVVCTDEMLLHPDPYPSRQAWCAARLTQTQARLSTLDPDRPVVFVNHYPLVREPTRALYYPEFAQWCGTVHTGDWHLRYPTAAMVYGHLHIPRSSVHDGVRFEEVSVGYPREWRRRGTAPNPPRVILPARELAERPPTPERI
jgi:3',5'-cyclic AMP phosphodiesterase CpdA